MRRLAFALGVLAAGLWPSLAHAASLRRFPLHFAAYTYPTGYKGMPPGYPCSHSCVYCDRMESRWRTDATNAVNHLSTAGLSALVGVEWPPGSGNIPFPTPPTAAQVNAYVQQIVNGTVTP